MTKMARRIKETNWPIAWAKAAVLPAASIMIPGGSISLLSFSISDSTSVKAMFCPELKEIVIEGRAFTRVATSAPVPIELLVTEFKETISPAGLLAR